MDDQFGGRTDDDLFYDDFEPVESETVVISDQPTEPPAPSADPAPISDPSPAPTTQTDLPAANVAPSTSASTSTNTQEAAPKEAAPKEAAAPAAPTKKSASTPHKSLSASRFADKPAATPKQQQPKPAPDPPSNAPTGPKEKTPRSAAAAPGGKSAPGHAGGNTADVTARLQSGANPRQKLTDTELAAKMEQMKLVSAEKARKFEMAEKDEKQHAQAYARGMEEARRRRAEDTERRKRGEEDRRRMDDERTRNRERKLKAMGMKEGGWDEGKEAMAEEESRRGFRGANGGIRGARSGAGGRFATKDGEEHDVDRFLDERSRGRGRGRGRGGRGGRGGHEAGSNGSATSTPAKSQQKAVVPKTEDFPALPSGAVDKSGLAAEKVDAKPEPILPLPTGGKWDDEMADLEFAKQAN